MEWKGNERKGKERKGLVWIRKLSRLCKSYKYLLKQMYRMRKIIKIECKLTDRKVNSDFLTMSIDAGKIISMNRMVKGRLT